MAITAAEQNIEKRMKRNKDSLSNLWGNIKYTNIHSIWVPEGEEREKAPQKIFEETITENFPNMGKEIASQIKLTKIKDKDKVLKETGKNDNIQGNSQIVS